MGKRETKQALTDSQNLQKETQKRYDDLLQQSQDRTQAGDPAAGGGDDSGGEHDNQYHGESTGEGGSSSGGSSGGNGFRWDMENPYGFGGNNPYVGDVTGSNWMQGDAVSGRSSNINNIRGSYGGANNPAEGSASGRDQRDALTGGYTDLHDNIEKLKAPGTIDTSELKNTLGGYRTFRDTGGLSDENISRIRGNGVFDEFSKTGGYSPEQIANIKAQALSPIGSFASGTRDELQRRAALQGGYTPGFDAASRQLQRDAARNIAATSLNANVGIQDKVNAGRQWGTGGVAASESALGSLQTANKLNALGGEAGIAGNLSNFSSQDIANLMNTDQFNIANTENMKLAGLQGLGGLYEGSMNRGENAFGRELMAQQGALDRGFNASEAAQNRGFSSTESMFDRAYGSGENMLNRGLTSSENSMDRELTRSENALNRNWQSGESNLNRNFTGGQNFQDRQQQEYNRQVQLLNSRFQTQLGGLNNQTQLAMQPGIGGNIMGLVGAGLGIGSQLMMPGARAGLGMIGAGMGANNGGVNALGAQY